MRFATTPKEEVTSSPPSIALQKEIHYVVPFAPVGDDGPATERGLALPAQSDQKELARSVPRLLVKCRRRPRQEILHSVPNTGRSGGHLGRRPVGEAM